jgi:tripartite tricarboxylate transporter family receptor
MPYRGNGPALADLLAAQVQVMFATMPSSIAYIRAGRLRALAVWAQDSRVISPSTTHPKTPIPGATTFTVYDRCCREYVDRRGSLCFSVCASRAGLTPSPTCPSLGKVASAKAEMWPLRQPNGDATRQPSSVRTDGGFLHVSEHYSSAAR